MYKYKKLEKSKFKKDYRKLISQHKNVQSLDNLIKELQNKDFTHAYKNHKLEPKSKNIWECHIGSETSDWVLVYKYEDDKLILILIRTGSHSEIFEEHKLKETI